MSKTIVLIAGIVLVVLALAGGIWLYDFVLGDTEVASAPVSAPTLEIAASATTAPTATAIPTQAVPSQTAATGGLRGPTGRPANRRPTKRPARLQDQPG